jgi:hypothetical protein
MKVVHGVITKAMRIGGLSAAGVVLATGLCPRTSYAQLYGAAAGAGTPFGGAVDPNGNPEADNFDGLVHADALLPGPPGDPFGAFGHADLQSGVVDTSTYGVTTLGGGGSYAQVFDTVTTGAVSGTMTLSVSADYTLDVNAPSNVGEDDELFLAAGQASTTAAADFSIDFNSDDWAWALEDIGYQGGVSGEVVETTPGWDGGSDPDDETFVFNQWDSTLSTTFAVSPDSAYYLGMESQSLIYLTSQSDGAPQFVGTSLDPTWSLSASPGVTYTTASGIPIGGSAATAPEPSVCALLLPVGGLLFTARRRVWMRRCARRV